MKNIFKQEDIQCFYWKKCGQVKKFDVCKKNYTKCIIYQRMKVLDKNKTKTGLERFISAYGEDWNKLGIGSMTEIPKEMKGEYKN